MSAPSLRALICGPGFAPPTTNTALGRIILPYVLTLSTICIASSRVGTNTSTGKHFDSLRLTFLTNLSKIGSTNAAVFPVPVWATPTISFPSRNFGITAN